VVPQESSVALTTVRNGTGRTIYFDVIDPQRRQLGWHKTSLAPGRTVLFTQYLSPQDQENNVRVDVPIRYKQRQKSTWSHDNEPWTGYRPTRNLLPRIVAARGVVSPQVIQGRVQEVVDPTKLRAEHLHRYVFVDFVTDADIWAEVCDKSRKPIYELLDLITEDAARRQHERHEQLRKQYEDQLQRQAEQRYWERQRRQTNNTSDYKGAKEMREAALRRLGEAATSGRSIVDLLK
jgi:hypothetical protein